MDHPMSQFHLDESTSKRVATFALTFGIDAEYVVSRVKNEWLDDHSTASPCLQNLTFCSSGDAGWSIAALHENPSLPLPLDTSRSV